MQIGAGDALARLPACRWPTTSAPPTLPPAGRARRWCRCSIARWRRASTGRGRSLVLNIGGVANVTWLGDGRRDPIACDTGPGNALIDDFMRARSGAAFDASGEAAAAGTVDEAWLGACLADPFFAMPPPKSLDRNAFAAYRSNICTSFRWPTARRHWRPSQRLRWRGSCRICRGRRESVIVAGGGARNRTLMRMLAERLAPATVETADAVGWSADALEAQAFAFLAARHVRGLPITFPGTTGVARAMTGGVIARPAA